MANEKRLIDANALSDEVDKSKHDNPHPAGMIRVNHRNEHDHFLKMIYDAPTVDAVEVVHGRWETVSSMLGYLCCSQCKDVYIWETWLGDGKWNYCPNCGAKMDGGNEDV